VEINVIYSKKLLGFKEIIHGFTTRHEGEAKAWLAKNPAVAKNLVLANQIHGDKIAYVEGKDRGKIIRKTDGLITCEKGLVLGIKTADCLPILFYEPVKKIIGAVHAGWRGTILGIAGKMVKEIERLGGDKGKIVCVLGPHIGMCCYDVSQERSFLFERKFGKDPRIVSFSDGKPHLDLAYANFLQLLESGIRKDNFETLLTCTSCQEDLFFSYRRSLKNGNQYGEMLSFIGISRKR